MNIIDNSFYHKFKYEYAFVVVVFVVASFDSGLSLVVS